MPKTKPTVKVCARIGRPPNPSGATASAPVLYLRMDARTEAAMEILRDKCFTWGFPPGADTARWGLQYAASVLTSDETLGAVEARVIARRKRQR